MKATNEWPATEKQVNCIKNLCLQLGKDSDGFEFSLMSSREASQVISDLIADRKNGSEPEPVVKQSELNQEQATRKVASDDNKPKVNGTKFGLSQKVIAMDFIAKHKAVHGKEYWTAVSKYYSEMVQAEANASAY